MVGLSAASGEPPGGGGGGTALGYPFHTCSSPARCWAPASECFPSYLTPSTLLRYRKVSSTGDRSYLYRASCDGLHECKCRVLTGHGTITANPGNSGGAPLQCARVYHLHTNPLVLPYPSNSRHFRWQENPPPPPPPQSWAALPLPSNAAAPDLRSQSEKHHLPSPTRLPASLLHSRHPLTLPLFSSSAYFSNANLWNCRNAKRNPFDWFPIKKLGYPFTLLLFVLFSTFLKSLYISPLAPTPHTQTHTHTQLNWDSTLSKNTISS